MTDAIEVVGELIEGAHPVKFLGPAAHPDGNVLQFFAIGGYLTAWRAAHMVVEDMWPEDHRFYNVKEGTNGKGVYVRFWQEG